MDQNVHVIAVLKARDGQIQNLLETLKTLTLATHQEAGCVEYGFYQDEKDTNTIVSFETWRDQQAETLHWKSEHLNSALQVFDQILESKPLIFRGPKVL